MRSLKKIRRWLDDRKKEAEKLAQEEKLKLKEKLHKIKLELQMELQATQTSQHPLHTNMSSNIWAKLPKLVTMKFDGTFVDWPQFWGQFTETIDKTSVIDNEILIPTRTAQLQSKMNNRGVTPHVRGMQSRKSSEIMKTYTKEILDIPPVPNANPKKISESSKKFTYCVQALRMLKKTEQVNVVVSMTLDRLPAIRGDLI